MSVAHFVAGPRGHTRLRCSAAARDVFPCSVSCKCRATSYVLGWCSACCILHESYVNMNVEKARLPSASRPCTGHGRLEPPPGQDSGLKASRSASMDVKSLGAQRAALARCAASVVSRRRQNSARRRRRQAEGLRHER